MFKIIAYYESTVVVKLIHQLDHRKSSFNVLVLFSEQLMQCFLKQIRPIL